MPDLDGLGVLARRARPASTTPIIIVTAQNTMDNAIEAMKRGAYDYVTKPFNIDEVRAVAARALEMSRLSTDLHRLERELRGRFEVGVAIVGNSPAMQEIYKTVGRVANTDATVLIQGESGTGKELIAKVIHYHSPRWSGPFIAINCSAIPRDLLESELFGHERGAFTGATEQRAGQVRAGAGRHALPRRDRRHAARAAGQAAARAAGARGDAPRRARGRQGRLPHPRRHQPVARARRQAAALPRGPLLPPQRRARSRFRRCASGAATSPS